ncbi:MAG: DUF6882 domain-containing protein [Pseudomonadota bacterium]|jgi:hypothetical protein
MKSPDWYDAWCDEAFDAFMARQKQLTETYRLGDWERYDYDAAARTLTFSDPKGARVVADIQVAGTIGAEDWLWGWANNNWPAAAVEAMWDVRRFGVENGIEELTTESLKSDDLGDLGWMLTAIAARILEAEGGYRAPSPEGGAIYFLILSIKFVS